jgi:uncharacterized damage-inducible protein DinB
MQALDLLTKAWDTAHWELGEAFKGLPDDVVWVRPHPRLLSIGEIAGHIAYWESMSFTGGTATGPLVDPVFRYYDASSQEPPVAKPLTAEQVYQEVERIHAAARAAQDSEPREPDQPNPMREGWTWGQTLEYMVFHVGYHTGQIYSVRHLMGHETTDN